jgi:hypothetical protein
MSNRHQHLLALEGPELAQGSVSIRFYVTLPYVAVAKKSGPTLLLFRVGQIRSFNESVQAHRALRNHRAIIEWPQYLFGQSFDRAFRTIWPDRFRESAGPVDSPNSSIFKHHALTIPDIPKCTSSKNVACLLLTGSFHFCSFLRVRPRRLLFPTTIRRRIHSSSAGLPQRKRTYLPKFTCGRGSSDLARTWSRIQEVGTVSRRANSRLSINS